MEKALEFLLRFKDISFEQFVVLLVLVFLFYINFLLIKKMMKKDLKCVENPCMIEVSLIAKDSNKRVANLETKCDLMIKKFDDLTRSNKLASQMERLRVLEGLDDDTIERIYDIFGKQ